MHRTWSNSLFLLSTLLIISSSCADGLASAEDKSSQLLKASRQTADFVPNFRDVTEAVGLPRNPEFKFGGPIVADVDDDGYYDLILTYHNVVRSELFFGSASGNFTKSSPFRQGGDIHGVTVTPRTALSREKFIIATLGAGVDPRPPQVYIAHPDKRIVKTSNDLIFTGNPSTGRGRALVAAHLSRAKGRARRNNEGGPDILTSHFLGVPLPMGSPGHQNVQLAYANFKGTYVVRSVPGFENVTQGRTAVTDIDGDGIMEFISFRIFTIFKLTEPFTFVDATSEFAPEFDVEDFSITAVVELDFDNDGDFDLYLARGAEGFVDNVGGDKAPKKSLPDILLENRDGKYVDVSAGAGIVGATYSIGVSAGDVNNDGYVDLIVTQHSGTDVLLLNNGNGTFTQMDPGIPKEVGVRSDNTLAFDYDNDGRVDFITAQGFRRNYKGPYILMRNEMALSERTNYLLVKVGNEPKFAATALHAVVKVKVGGMTMVRRVGDLSSQKAGPGSFHDTLHFGLGTAKRADYVSVTWTTGRKNMRRNLRANQLVKMGKFL